MGYIFHGCTAQLIFMGRIESKLRAIRYEIAASYDPDGDNLVAESTIVQGPALPRGLSNRTVASSASHPWTNPSALETQSAIDLKHLMEEPPTSVKREDLIESLKDVQDDCYGPCCGPDKSCREGKTVEVRGKTPQIVSEDNHFNTITVRPPLPQKANKKS